MAYVSQETKAKLGTASGRYPALWLPCGFYRSDGPNYAHWLSRSNLGNKMPLTRTLVIAGLIVAALFMRQEHRMTQLEDNMSKVVVILEQLNDLVDTKDHLKYTKHELNCLTKNIYYEAGVENDAGKYAVGQVTLNRLKTGYWGNNICQVVYSKAQFSWTLNKKLPKPNPVLWAQSRIIAINTLNGKRVRGLTHSLFYHANYIEPPEWVDPSKFIVQIGQHIFYTKAKYSWVKV